MFNGNSEKDQILKTITYKNYKAITKLLSNKRYQLKYIAKHYFI
jgi:hypothetical protein